MGFNRRKMEDQRRPVAEKEAASRMLRHLAFADRECRNMQAE
jgi:hypothetical protein